MFRSILYSIIFFCIIISVVSADVWDFPPLPSPSQYGNILINRLSEKNNQLPVSFSHWKHRQNFTCRVCHFELDFQMKVNTTEITEKDNRDGMFCGTCHNGISAFGHTEENCTRCHNGNIAYGEEKYKKLRSFPTTAGDFIDWSAAVRRGLIKPRQTLWEEDYKPIEFNKFLTLEAEWKFVKPAIFPHKEHNEWLDCANCHPDIFNVKKKTTKHFLMEYILEGKFCGACHLTVAFPIQDCRRCHPDMKMQKLQ